MKYGEALPLRSVQEWLPHNLDYNEIKQLIKHYTTTKSPATNSDPTEWEDELFEVLLDQLGRIDLFVKSKAGEIDRRIASCERQLAELQRRAPSAKSSAKIAARYSKIEQEIERAGHNVQSLARFVNVQRTGFHKLLKKYRKWAGSSHLPDRFLVLLESPTAFHRHDFDRCVLVVSELLATVRDRINKLSDESYETVPPQQGKPSTGKAVSSKGTALPLHVPAPNPKTRLEWDTAFGTSHIANGGGRAVFWVHKDHVIELQVFLLKHLTLQTWTPACSIPATPLSSRRNSDAGPPGHVDHVGHVVLDDLGSFSDVQNTATIDQVSRAVMRTAGQVRWCSRDLDASVVVSDYSGAILNTENLPNSEVLNVTTRRKNVEALLDPKTESTGLKEGQCIQTKQSIDRIRGWFSKHPGVTPLAKILSRKIRFIGSVSGGEAWASLDRDIVMCSNAGEPGWVASDETGEGKITEFPHSVVEILWDGKQTPSFVTELMQSHIVESVPGFSLDVHAIATLYKPKHMLSPFWLSALNKDIRKTPTVNRPTHSRRNSSRVVFSNPSSQNSSVVTGDSGLQYQMSTPATSDAGALSRESRRKKRRTSRPHGRPADVSRYWSEFDDEEREAPYTILVRPSSSSSMEDGDTLSAYIASPVLKAVSRLKNLGRKSHMPCEHSPLLGESVGPDTETDSETEVGGLNGFQGYSTFKPPHPSSGNRAAYNAGHLGLLAFSALMLLVTGALAIGESLSGHKRRRKNIGKHIVVDLSVFAGALVCVISGIIGLTIFVAGGSRVSLQHRIAVWTTFALVCTGCGAILTVASRDIVGEA